MSAGRRAIAALEEGFRCILIEKDEGYMKIAEARLNGRQVGLGLDVPAPTRKGIGKQRGNKDADGKPTLGSRRSASENWSGGWAGSDFDGRTLMEISEEKDHGGF